MPRTPEESAATTSRSRKPSDPDLLAQEIAGDLRTAANQFAAIGAAVKEWGRVFRNMADGEPDQFDAAPTEKLFAFVLNNLDVTCVTPVEIIPNHVLRRPTQAEFDRIREGLQRLGAMMDLSVMYETKCVEGQSKDGTTAAHFEPQDPSEWRYWVIAVTQGHTGAVNRGLLDLQRASRLADVELLLQLNFYPGGGIGFGWWTGADRFARTNLFDPPERFDDATLRAVRDASDGIESAASRFKEIARAVEMYYRLSAIPKAQPLYLLGVFSVIEALLTHDPSAGGYDSLTHQIKTKMALLDRRFKPPLNYSAFGKCDLKKVWSLMYQLRSCIAHGSEPDFSGKLKPLVGMGQAVRFLDAAAKTLLRHSLAEPQLILDLQAC